MASKYLQKYPVPEGFHQILHDFAREVLRDQPEDIIKYGAEYFECMTQGKEFKFESKYNIAKGQAPGKHYKPPMPQDVTVQAKRVVDSSNGRPQSTHRVGSANPVDVSMGSQGSHPEEKKAATEYVNDLYAKIAEDIDNQEAEVDNQTELIQVDGQVQVDDQVQVNVQENNDELPELSSFNDKDMEKIVKIQAAAKGTIIRKQAKDKNQKSQKAVQIVQEQVQEDA